MEKIGDYIPLIIIALTFIYSFFKKVSKKVSENEADITILPNDIPKKEISVPQVKMKAQPLVYKSIENKLQENTTPFLENTTQPLTVVDEISEENGFVLNFDNAEELKKGIIYAEIFNRKY